MEPGFTVRPASSDDLTALGTLAGDLVRFHHAIDPLRYLLVPDVDRGYAWWFGKELASPDAVLLVAEGEGGALLGYIYGRIEGRDWNLLLDAHAGLHDILVRDDARRAGVGRALLQAFNARVRARGVPRVVLHTAVSNVRAQALFREAGFRPTMLEMTLELQGDPGAPGEGSQGK